MVIDLFLLAELCWWTLLVSARGLHRAMVYTGGVMASGYASYQLSDWLGRILAAPSSTVFRWVEGQLSQNAVAVSALSSFIPPISAAASPGNKTQWIAYHVIMGLLGVSLTFAVFLTFAAVAALSEAIWDRTGSLAMERRTKGAVILAFCCGLYVVLLTGYGIGNLAWIRALSMFSTSAIHSLGVVWIAHLQALMQTVLP